MDLITRKKLSVVAFALIESVVTTAFMLVSHVGPVDCSVLEEESNINLDLHQTQNSMTHQ